MYLTCRSISTRQALFFLLPTCATIVCATLPVSEFDNGDGTVDKFMTADVSVGEALRVASM